MIEDYLKRNLPKNLLQPVMAAGPTAESARLFVAGYTVNKDALKDNSIGDLLKNADFKGSI